MMSRSPMVPPVAAVACCRSTSRMSVDEAVVDTTNVTVSQFFMLMRLPVTAPATVSVGADACAMLNRRPRARALVVMSAGLQLHERGQRGAAGLGGERREEGRAAVDARD